MAIFDCFQYFNEDHIADLRFNILNESVDKFIIVESTVNHQGKSKKLHFDIIPKTVDELDLLSKDAFLQSANRDQNVGKIAIAYTVWSKKKVEVNLL